MIEILIQDGWIAVRDDSIRVGEQKGKGGATHGGDSIVYYPLGTSFEIDISKDHKHISADVPFSDS